MNQKTDFTFYSILKGEDAEPYVGDSLLAVADGLGGAGSAVHHIAWENFGDPENAFYKAAYGDFRNKNGMEDALKQWMRLVTDGAPDTSALWASRIVIARFVYAMTNIDEFRLGNLGEERVRKELSEFIGKGLECTAQHFSLSMGKYGNQRLLPTTLAAIKYAEDEEVVTAEAIWAGDSRCYVLTKEGVKPLSEDDEDASGAITNLFYAGDVRTILHYKKVTLPKPCALFAVSDGTFDPFEPHDHFGLEYMLLSAMTDCGSVEELCSKLQANYEKIHADDTTMAFAAFGFADYESMQLYFGERAQYIEEVWKDLCDRKDELEVKNSSVEEAMSYIRSRTADKLDAILKTLIACYLDGEQDICFTPQFMQTVEDAKQSASNAFLAATNAQREINLTKLRETLYRYRENPDEILRSPRFFHKHKWLPTKEYKKIKAIYNAILSTAESAQKGKKNLPRYEQQKMDRIRTDAENLASEIESLQKSIAHLLETQEFSSVIPTIKEAVGTLHENAMKLESEQQEMAERCEEWKENLKQAEANLNARLDEYIILVKESPALAKVIFEGKFLIECGWKDVEPKTPEELHEETVKTALAILNSKKTEVVCSIADCLAQHYRESSLIDPFYNATRLQKFRNCCRLHRDPDSFLEDLERQIHELEEEYK